MPDEPKDNWVDTKTVINSHTPTEWGKYDEAEPLPFDANAYGWYLRATYWKQKFHRNEGLQRAIDFGKPVSKWKVPNSGTHGNLDLQTVMNYCTSNQKINGIKYIREQSGWGLKESKDWIEEFAAINGVNGAPWKPW